MVTSTPAPSPRLDKRHTRHASDARHGRSQQENEFLRVQAARLSTTKAILFAKLSKYSAEQIASAASLSAIP